MNSRWKRFSRELSTLLTAILLAVALWAIAVNATDPVEKRVYSGRVTIDVIGLKPELSLASPLPENVNVIISAPQSVWTSELSGQLPVLGKLDLTDFDAGTYDVPLEIFTQASPVRIDSYTPTSLSVTIQQIEVR